MAADSGDSRRDPYESLRQAVFDGRPDDSRPVRGWTSDELLKGTDPSHHSHQQWLAWRELRTRGQTPPPERADAVLGVICEFRVGGAPVSVVGFPDGDASVYISGGGGIVGGGAYEAVRKRAMDLIERAHAVLRSGQTLRETPPLPENGEVVFNMLTPNGVKSIRARERDVRRRGHELRDTFSAMHDLITCLRLTQAWHKKNPSDQENKYVNCLLTIMAENGRGVVEFDSASRPPALSTIAKTQDQRDWLASEQVAESSIRTSMVIRLLKKLTRFGWFRSRKGELEAQLFGSAGPAPFVFRVERNRSSDGNERLSLEL